MAQQSAPQQVVWRFTAAAPIEHVDVASATDAVVVADRERSMHVLDQSGAECGKFRAGQPVRRVRANRMGTVFVALAGEGILYAFDREGRLDWRVELAGQIDDFGVSVSAEHVAAMSAEGWLHVYSQATRERLVLPVGVPMRSVAIVNEDPLQIVVCTQAGNVSLIDTQGNCRWRKDFKTQIGPMGRSMGGDLVAVAAREQGLHMLHLDGGLAGVVNLEEPVLAASVSDDGALIMAQTASGRMVLVDQYGTVRWEMQMEEMPLEWSYGAQGALLAVVNQIGEVEAYKVSDVAEPEPAAQAAVERVSDGSGFDDFIEVEEALFGSGTLELEVEGTSREPSVEADVAPARPATPATLEGAAATDSAIFDESAASAEMPAAPPAPPSTPRAKLIWKRRLRANALPAAQSLFAVALDGTYIISVLTDGRALVLDEEGHPAVKTQVGLPAKIVPAFPGKMVGAWSRERMALMHPASGRVRHIEFEKAPVIALDGSDDLRKFCTLDNAGRLSCFEASDIATWERDVGEVAASVFVSPRGGTMLVADRDGRFRYYDAEGRMVRKFRFPPDSATTVLALGEDFTVFRRGAGRLAVVDGEGKEAWSGSVFPNMLGGELLGRQVAVYGPGGACAVLDPWADSVHEMMLPPGRVRLCRTPGHDPVAVHVAGKVVTAFVGYRRKLEVAWRFDCESGIEMFGVDMDATVVAVLAENKLYRAAGPEPA